MILRIQMTIYVKSCMNIWKKISYVLLLEPIYKREKMLFTISNGGISTVNCELFILERKEYNNVIYH